MKGKPKKKQPEAINATAIAARAGCSRQLVCRLLKRGFSEEQIIRRISENRAREAARAAVANGNGAAPVSSLPLMPWPAFSISEARKEHLLAELRDLQLMRERGELIPVSYVKQWAATFLTEGRDILMQGPGELQDQLAAESDPLKVSAILRRWVEKILERFHKTGKLWGEGAESKGDVA
jgi:hypothetical protein